MAMCDWCGYHCGHDVECPCHPNNCREPGMSSACMDCDDKWDTYFSPIGNVSVRLSDDERGAHLAPGGVALGDLFEGLEAPLRASERQVGGGHYKQFAIQPVDFIYQNGLDYLTGNVIKYVLRHRDKNGREDLEKAIHYIEMLLEQEYS